jgi:hypothetical protein
MVQLVDWEYCARIAVRDGISYVDDALASYRIHDSSVSAQNSIRRNYRAKVLDPLIILHELVHSPFYRQVRYAANRVCPAIKLHHTLVQSARSAYELAQSRAADSKHPDVGPITDWNDLIRYYPRLASLPPSYVFVTGLRRAKKKIDWMRNLAKIVLAQP